MHIVDLALSPAALASLRAAGLADVDQLASHSAGELIARGFGAVELYEVVCRLNERGRSLSSEPTGPARLPQARHRELLRLRVVEGLTMQEIGERAGLSPGSVKQLLRLYFGLDGTVPTVEARRWAANQRRRSEAATRRKRTRPARRHRRGTRHLSVVRPRDRGPCSEPPPDAA